MKKGTCINIERESEKRENEWGKIFSQESEIWKAFHWYINKVESYRRTERNHGSLLSKAFKEWQAKYITARQPMFSPSCDNICMSISPFMIREPLSELRQGQPVRLCRALEHALGGRKNVTSCKRNFMRHRRKKVRLINFYDFSSGVMKPGGNKFRNYFWLNHPSRFYSWTMNFDGIHPDFLHAMRYKMNGYVDQLQFCSLKSSFNHAPSSLLIFIVMSEVLAFQSTSHRYQTFLINETFSISIVFTFSYF